MWLPAICPNLIRLRIFLQIRCQRSASAAWQPKPDKSRSENRTKSSEIGTCPVTRNRKLVSPTAPIQENTRL